MKERDPYIRKCIPIRTDLDASQLLPLISQCAEIFNIYTKWAYENKTINKNKAHKELYRLIREQFSDVPSALVQSMRDCALECVKKEKFRGKPPVKKQYSSIRYGLTAISLFKENKLTLSTTKKRIKTIVNIPDYFKLIVDNWKFTGATVGLKRDGYIWVNLGFKTERSEQLEEKKELGVDKGIHNIAVLSNGTIFNSKEVRKHKRKHLYLRRKLQAKGTRSAKKRLRSLSGKEKRFSLNVNHKLSKEIVNLPYETIVVEDLKGIRALNKGKRMNGLVHSWSFYQLDQFLIYKAEALGKRVVKVDPKHTSQMCSCCGCIDKRNRNKSKFKCINADCGYSNHSDINASINIKNKYISSIERSEEQAAVNQPYVSSDYGLYSDANRLVSSGS